MRFDPHRRSIDTIDDESPPNGRQERNGSAPDLVSHSEAIHKILSLNKLKMKTLEASLDKTKIKRRPKVQMSVTGKCPFVSSSETKGNSDKEPIKIKNFLTSRNLTDVLYLQANAEVCSGSILKPHVLGESTPKRSVGEIFELSKEFLEEYFIHTKKSEEEMRTRFKTVEKELEATGTYTLTPDELGYGARMAWRNASRCIGRIQWNKLDFFDARSAKTTKEMFDACCAHIEKATNEGNIRSAITVFRQRIHGKGDVRLWNSQLISFAGYLQPDGSVIGDPARVQFTRICERLGWKGKGTPWDILPIVVSTPEEGPKFYDIPSDIVMTVPIEHPTIPEIKSLKLKWYALPAVSDMLFDVGGLEFPCAPFNGWYMGTEIGCRNFCDEARYNLLPVVGKLMGLDIDSDATLWKDRVLVEMNVAVLHSFNKSGVTMVDHHTASQSFVTHMANETKSRGGCPADWVWITPPLSGSATPVFHQEMLNYHVTPSFEYQEVAWKNHKWKKVNLKYKFKSVATAVFWSVTLNSIVISKRVRATILFASETGKSEAFAVKLEKRLRSAFKTDLIRMDEYDMRRLNDEKLIFVVASTFGNGDPPDNGKSFWKLLNTRVRKAKNSSSDEEKEIFMLRKLTFAVFGLGSSSYPTFASFSKNIDRSFHELGAKRMKHIEIGDELKGQEKVFNAWCIDTVKSTFHKFAAHPGGQNGEHKSVPGENEEEMVEEGDETYKQELVRLRVVGQKSHLNPTDDGPLNMRPEAVLSRIHGEKRYPSLFSCQIINKTRLLPENNKFGRQTLLVRLRPATPSAAALMEYTAGDHLGIFPSNQSDLVDDILTRLSGQKVGSDIFRKEFIDNIVVLETRSDTESDWKIVSRLPPCSIRDALLSYLDITTPPTRICLASLAETATDSWDEVRLQKLSEDPERYKKWRNSSYPNLLEIFKEFPSIKPKPEFFLLTLPLLSPRLYSISSSPKSNPEEIHLTMSLVSWTPTSGAKKYGVATHFFDSLPETPIPCFIRSAPNFRLPSDLSIPIIMICAGSGIAPFRGFWQEREQQFMKKTLGRRLSMTPLSPTSSQSNNHLPQVGRAILLFGCRSVHVDQLYQREIDSLLSKGILSDVFLALTREEGVKKRYVQDVLYKQRILIYEMLREGAHVYVCGDAIMAEGVRCSFLRIYETQGKMDRDSAHDAFDDLRDVQRYHEDVFGILHPTLPA